MICQDSNKFSNSTLVGWLFAEEADNEVFVVFCMEHYKLIFSIGDTQPSQLQGDNMQKTIKIFSEDWIRSGDNNDGDGFCLYQVPWNK